MEGMYEQQHRVWDTARDREEAAAVFPLPPPRCAWRRRPLFNQGAVNALARAERVTIYVNDNGQMLIVRPSEGNDVPRGRVGPQDGARA